MDKMIKTIQEHKGKVLSAVVAALIAILATLTDIGVDVSGAIQDRLSGDQVGQESGTTE